MKVSQIWLKQFVDFKFTPEQFTEKLTMLGLEVESYEDLAKKYENFIIGEVIERAKHPHADRLTICKVNIGDAIQEVVCGAPNVAAGQKVVVALIGAIIPHNQHDPEGKPFIIERVKIRGVESNGMICSELELGLGKDASGILVLDEKAKAGTSLANYFGQTDVVYEIGITPNRADCLSHIGVAREIGLLVNKKLKMPKIVLKESTASAWKFAEIEILDKEKCPRYSARVLRNIKIGPSPKWLQDLLTSVGVRPINNVVDVTNYVLMETGHPLHAFDYDTLTGHKIVVKTAQNGEKFITLDGKERTLTAETLMICDAEKPIAVAGVMGGANTEITDATTNILIESAYFDPRNIRRTSKYLGLSTEASYRFERGTDINITVLAANRAAQMIQELTSGELLKGALDAYPKKQKPLIVKARVSRINSIIGTSLKKAQIISLLKQIDLAATSSSKDEILVSVPSFRNDILEEIDIIEEVARVYGYNNIETKTRAAIDFSSNVRTDLLQDEIRDYLIGSGFNEVLAIGLQDEATMALAGKPLVKAINPVSAEMAALRTSLVPSALRIVKHNRNHGVKDLRLFEIGNIYLLNTDKGPDTLDAYHEDERLLLLLGGHTAPVSYGSTSRDVDMLDLKGEVAALLSKFCLDNYRFIYYDNQESLCEPCIGMKIDGADAGFVGRVRVQIADELGIEEAVFVCELKIRAIHDGWARDRKFSSLPKFPGVTRDLAFTIEAALPQKSVEDVIRKVGQPLCTNVVLFDMYSGQQTGSEKKSLAYALEFQSPDRTLTDREIDDALKKIIEAVQRQCNGVLRS
ncbi:MAG: phenylalanine--tRNA ligase subunit beta [Ignavibacteriales bacterium]|nr:phenylalanine--tRNA ligase subunit beta [Ignavibacteriales bacterium]